ncbi:MAG: hypothetical protein WC222_08590 [Parachlamydiales bacterium]|jgi:hypothetical protein
MTQEFYSEEEPGNFPLNYEIDAAIVMHRDSHFAGQFSTMIEYYRNNGVGVMEEFDLERIEELAAQEAKTLQNLAISLLTGPDAERVAAAREAYKNLKEVYEIKSPKNKYPQLIADLILAEDPHAKVEVEAIVAEKHAIVPSLIELINSEDFYDPLFPGYGLAPEHALACLQKIGDKRAIIALFESIGKHDFFNEDVAISALWHIGEPAKDFLLRVLRSKPYNEDNERAAIALVAFEEDEEVAQACWEILRGLDLRQYLLFAEYLILCCEGLRSPAEREAFISFGNSENIPKELRGDIKSIINCWK